MLNPPQEGVRSKGIKIQLLGKVDILGDETVAINWFSYLCEDYNLYGKKNAFIAGQEMWSTMVLETVGKGINARIATGVSQVVSIGISPK